MAGSEAPQSQRPPQVTLLQREGVEGIAGLDEARVTDLLSRAWRLHQGPSGAEVEVVLMGAEEHTELHARFLDDPTPTDVMAFPYEEEDLYGEVLVNLDMARAQAAERGIDARAEAELYVVHGALHLLGLDDRDPESRTEMRAAERAVLEE